MENLLRFLSRNSPFFTWLFLSLISITLLFQSVNPYHRSIWLGSANSVVGGVYDFQNSVTQYFGLRTINEDLLERTALLEGEVIQLRAELQAYKDKEALDTLQSASPQYRYMMAHVVGNSINQLENYITLNKGAADGLHQDLGVADQNGVIGIVASVSEHYALVLSVLNPKLRVSVMLAGSESFGSLVWDGKDSRYAIMEDLPRNAVFQMGDTIVTTGYASSFPKNIPVGRVSDVYDQGGNFLNLRVELFADFNRLNDVHIIYDNTLDERTELLLETVEN